MTIGLPRNVRTRADAYTHGMAAAEELIHQDLDGPIDVLQEGFSREYMTEPVREALLALVRFRHD